MDCLGEHCPKLINSEPFAKAFKIPLKIYVLYHIGSGIIFTHSFCFRRITTFRLLSFTFAETCPTTVCLKCQFSSSVNIAISQTCKY